MDRYRPSKPTFHVPVTKPQRLTSEAPMSDPRWRETRPSSPYSGEPGARPRGPVPVPPPGARGGTAGRPPTAGVPRGPGPRDASSRDAGARDAGARDASSRDASSRDASQRGRDPGWDGRGAGGRTGTGPNGRGASPRGVGDG